MIRLRWAQVGRSVGWLRSSTGQVVKHNPDGHLVVPIGHVTCVGHVKIDDEHSPVGHLMVVSGHAVIVGSVMIAPVVGSTISVLDRHKSGATTQLLSSHLKGAVDGQPINDGQSEMEARQLPDGHKNGSDGGHSNGFWHWSMEIEHSPPEQRIWVSAQVLGAEQYFKSVTHAPVETHCNKPCAEHDFGWLQIARDDLQVKSAHKTGSVDGHVGLDGQSNKFCTHEPLLQRNSVGAHSAADGDGNNGS